MVDYEYLLSDINTINGIGIKTKKLFKKKNINTIFDLLWSPPKSFVDRSILSKITEIKIGEIQTLKVKVKKYNFPRVRNLPNKVTCQDETGTLDCIFFKEIALPLTVFSILRSFEIGQCGSSGLTAAEIFSELSDLSVSISIGASATPPKTDAPAAS